MEHNPATMKYIDLKCLKTLIDAMYSDKQEESHDTEFVAPSNQA